MVMLVPCNSFLACCLVGSDAAWRVVTAKVSNGARVRRGAGDRWREIVTD